jgi:hypothetical protein
VSGTDLNAFHYFSLSIPPIMKKELALISIPLNLSNEKNVVQKKRVPDESHIADK